MEVRDFRVLTFFTICKRAQQSYFITKRSRDKKTTLIILQMGND